MLFMEMDVDNDGVISLSDLLRFKYASRRVLPVSEEEETETTDSAPSGESEPSPTVIQVDNLFNKYGMAKSPSGRGIQLADGKESTESVDNTKDEISGLLKDMDLSSSSSSDEPQEGVKVTPSHSRNASQDTPKQGLSFRHIDFASLPQTSGDSSDDDHLLSDWDGPKDEKEGTKTESDAKPTLSKSKSKNSFGNLKKAISKRLR